MNSAIWSVEITNTTPDKVWDIITDPGRVVEWTYKDGAYPCVVEGRYVGQQQEGEGTQWVVVAEDGQEAVCDVVGWEPPNRLIYVTSLKNPPIPEIKQQHTFEIAASESNVVISWQVAWDWSWVWALWAFVLRWTIAEDMEDMIAGGLGNLKELLEKD